MSFTTPCKNFADIASVYHTVQELCRHCLSPHRASIVPTLSFATASQCEHCADIVFCHSESVRALCRHCLLPHRVSASTVPTLSFATASQCENCADIVFCHTVSVRALCRHCPLPQRVSARTEPTLSFATPCQCENCAIQPPALSSHVSCIVLDNCLTLSR